MTKKFFLEVFYYATWNFHTLDYQHRWSDDLPRIVTFRLINIYQHESQEYYNKKDWKACQASCEQQIEKAQKIKHAYFQAMGLRNLAVARYYQNDKDNARTHIAEAIRLCEAGIRNPKSEKELLVFIQLAKRKNYMRNGCWSRSIALRMVRNLRMQAVRATFFCLPRFNKCWYWARISGL
jgi:hypothetical protein